MKQNLKFSPAEPLLESEVAPEAVTVINVFEAAPGRQDELVRLLQVMTEQVTRHMRGFVCATLHRARDGRHVANHVEWRSSEDWAALGHDREAHAYMERIRRIATMKPHVYDTVSVHRP